MSKSIAKKLLLQHWVHSREEDTDTEMVFRPANFQFPPSRGRVAFEFRSDDHYVESQIGPTDAPIQQHGEWKLLNDGSIVLNPTTKQERVLEISSVGKEKLVIKK